MIIRKILAISLFVLICLANRVEAYNDKTSVVSKSYDSMGGWKSSCAKGDYRYCGRKGLASGYVSVNHRVSMTSGGYNVSVGDPINFSYNPDDPFFVVTGNGSMDTPYGKWVNSINDRISRSLIKSDGFYFYDASLGRYIYWVAEKPMVSMSSGNPSVINCSGMNCSATGQGITTLTANINTTQAREWAVVKNSNEFLLSYDGVVTDSTGYVDASLSWDDNDILPLPSTSMSWIVTVTAPTPINGSCGTRNTSYLSTITAWPIGSTLCLAGAASPASVAFPSAGSSSVWQCLGSSGGATVNCTATRDATAINGSCGSAQGSYLPTDTVWRAPFCNSGTPSPVAPIFPTLGSTTNWQCIGSGTGHTDASCSATKNYANPTVTLTASPTTINNINNNTLTPGTANTTLTWNITNQAQACGGLCTCDLTEIASGSTTSNIAYPATSSSTKTIGPGTYNYSITCINPQNNTGTDTETVTATCTPQTGATTCSELCGPGNQIIPTLDTSCNFSNVNTGNSCNNGACPASTSFEEVKL